jgi:hypothetical protein
VLLDKVRLQCRGDLVRSLERLADGLVPGGVINHD